MIIETLTFFIVIAGVIAGYKYSINTEDNE